MERTMARPVSVAVPLKADPPSVPTAEPIGRFSSDSVRTEFVGAAVHELGQPLTVLRGQVQLARRYMGQDATRAQTALDLAIAQVDRMTQMIAELQDLTRLATNAVGLQFVTFDLVTAASDAVERHQHGDTVRIRLGAPRTGVHVAGDLRRIAQILDNLLDNALKYSAPETPIAVTVCTADGEAQVRVADCGVGVSNEERDRLFAPYYRSSRTRNVLGTGLGLHISRQLAERHGGRLWLESTSSAGSLFALALPLAQSVNGKDREHPIPDLVRELSDRKEAIDDASVVDQDVQTAEPVVADWTMRSASARRDTSPTTAVSRSPEVSWLI